MSLDPLESFPETRLALWICILRVNSVRYGRQGIRSSSPPPLSCARRGSGQGAGRPGSPSRRKNRLDRPQHGSAPGSFPTCEIFSISPPHGHAFRQRTDGKLVGHIHGKFPRQQFGVSTCSSLGTHVLPLRARLPQSPHSDVADLVFPLPRSSRIFQIFKQFGLHFPSHEPSRSPWQRQQCTLRATQVL